MYKELIFCLFLYYLKSVTMFIAKRQRVCQNWLSTEKSNANISLDMVSSFFSSTVNNDGLFGFTAKDSYEFKV